MKKKIHFEKLTPSNDVDINVYDEAFEYVFDNNDIKNIAISGPYSSGKSSVLRTYEKTNNKKNFIYISLSQFKDINIADNKINEKDNSNKDDKKESNIDEKKQSEFIDSKRILEGKIINQLIQQIDVENIPKTIFKTKDRNEKKNFFLYSAYLVLLFILIFYIKYFEEIKNWYNTIEITSEKNLLHILILPINPFLCIIAICVMLVFGITYLLKLQSTKNFIKKLTVNGNVIEILEDNEISIFDKYLNEILYLFENAKCDAVVFEDIDRYNQIEIFEHLREINTLVNIRLQKEYKTIRFFYLVKDDIFENKERTKFFDYIIPVIPVIDSSNSYNKLKNMLEKGALLKNIDHKFLRSICLYIDDIRLLKNIYNEFVIYFNKLNVEKTGLNNEKLFSIIVYKNIIPTDFALLQLKKGYLYSLFNNKKYFLNIINEKIEEVEKNKKTAENEVAKSAEELLVIKDKALQDAGYGAKRTKVLEEFTIREKVLEKINQNNFDYYKSIHKELMYRKKLVAENKLVELLDLDNDEYFEYCKNLNSNLNTINSDYMDLIKFLIKNGYIDETYNDYITYFYENSLTLNDKKFVRCIKDRKSLDFDYDLNNIELIIEYLLKSDYTHESILNVSLIEYAMFNCIKEQQSISETILKYKRYDFIEHFYINSGMRFDLLRMLFDYSEKIYFYIINESYYRHNLIKCIVIDSFSYLTKEELIKANLNDCIKLFIQKDPLFLNIEEPNTKIIIEAMSTLKIKLINFDFERYNDSLLREIYNNSLYELSYENTSFFLKKFYNVKPETDINTMHLSLIFSQDTALKEYIEDNISTYINIILCNCAIVKDNEKIIKYILSNSSIDDKDKLQYLSKTESKINNFDDIEHVYWDNILEKNIIEYNEENILTYYMTFGLTDKLIKYIESDSYSLNFSEYEISQELNKFFSDISINKEISNKKYDEIVSTGQFILKVFTTINLSSEKVDSLIKHNRIIFNTTILNHFRQNYHELKIKYIAKNIDSFISMSFSRNEIYKNELLDLIETEISDESKLTLLSKTWFNITIINKSYNKTVLLYILNNKFIQNEKTYLYENYSKYDEEIKNWILDNINMSELLNKSNKVDKQLLLDYIKNIHFSIENRYKVFSNRILDLELSEVELCLKELDDKEILKTFTPNTRPKIKKNENTKLVLEYFKNKEIIKDFYLDDKNPSIFKIKRK